MLRSILDNCIGIGRFLACLAIAGSLHTILLAGPSAEVPDWIIAYSDQESVHLKWPRFASSGAYQVERAVAREATYLPVSKRIVVTSFTDTDVHANQTYYYRVRASNNGVFEEPSAVVYGTPTEGFLDWIPPGANLETLATGFSFCEGPVWLPQDGGYWVFSDTLGDKLYKFSHRDGLSIFRDPGRVPIGNAVDALGRLVTCEADGHRITRTELDGSVVVLVDSYQGKRLNAPNDLAIAGDGSIWFTDPTYAAVGFTDSSLGRNIYRFDPLTRMLDLIQGDSYLPNGVAFSPDFTRVYLGQSELPYRVLKHEIRDDGEVLTGKLVARTFSGRPDGLKTDGQGRLYVAMDSGQIQVFDPDDNRLGTLPIPRPVSNLAFGGPDGSMMLITGDTTVYGITRMPDLIAVSPSVKDDRLTVTIHNQGTGEVEAGALLEMAIKIDENARWTWSQTLEDALRPGGVLAFTIDLAVREDLLSLDPGRYHFEFTVDPNSLVEEGQETNNTLSVDLDLPWEQRNETFGLNPTRILGADQALPGSEDSFKSVSYVGSNQGRLTFSGRTEQDHSALYALKDGGVDELMDLNTFIPEQLRISDTYTIREIVSSEDSIYFVVSFQIDIGTEERHFTGLYQWQDGQIIERLRTLRPLPNGKGGLLEISNLVEFQGGLYFFGIGEGHSWAEIGIYRLDKAGLQNIVNSEDIPKIENTYFVNGSKIRIDKNGLSFVLYYDRLGAPGIQVLMDFRDGVAKEITRSGSTFTDEIGSHVMRSPSLVQGTYTGDIIFFYSVGESLDGRDGEQYPAVFSYNPQNGIIKREFDFSEMVSVVEFMNPQVRIVPPILKDDRRYYMALSQAWDHTAKIVAYDGEDFQVLMDASRTLGSRRFGTAYFGVNFRLYSGSLGENNLVFHADFGFGDNRASYSIDLPKPDQPASLALLPALNGAREIFSLHIRGETGKTYRLEGKNDLNPSPWQPIHEFEYDEPMTWQDPESAALPMRFYRLVEVLD